jgi:hypothetical protein
MIGRRPIAIVSFLLWAAAVARGQDQAEPPRREWPEPTPRFFERPIDYWQRGIVYERPGGDERNERTPGPRTPGSAPTSDWGQMVKGPDGSLTFHELPKPLVQVLENPSPENIRAYFQWRMSRAQKVLRAAELMKEYKSAAATQPGSVDSPPSSAPFPPLGVPAAPSENPPAPRSDAPGAGALRPFTLRYFHKQGCPHCDSQDIVLAGWLKDRPEGRLEVVEFGTSPDLWRTSQVRGTPSIVVEDGPSRKSRFLEGLSSAETLSAALTECRRQDAGGSSVKGDPKK